MEEDKKKLEKQSEPLKSEPKKEEQKKIEILPKNEENKKIDYNEQEIAKFKEVFSTLAKPDTNCITQKDVIEILTSLKRNTLESKNSL